MIVMILQAVSPPFAAGLGDFKDWAHIWEALPGAKKATIRPHP
jgi:hypothetical protein